MNKKALIFLLSAMLFLTISFIVYSWTEPTTPMPSGYTAPLNTSATAQNKVGELGAASFVDADDSNYYINPSGDSIMSGNITTSGNIITARPTESDQVTTKGYVDEQIALVRSIVTGAQTLVNGAHTWNECEAAGGTVVDSDVELKVCKFTGSACPSQWGKYKFFSACAQVDVPRYYCGDNHYAYFPPTAEKPFSGDSFPAVCSPSKGAYGPPYVDCPTVCQCCGSCSYGAVQGVIIEVGCF